MQQTPTSHYNKNSEGFQSFHTLLAAALTIWVSSRRGHKGTLRRTYLGVYEYPYHKCEYHGHSGSWCTYYYASTRLEYQTKSLNTTYSWSIGQMRSWIRILPWGRTHSAKPSSYVPEACSTASSSSNPTTWYYCLPNRSQAIFSIFRESVILYIHCYWNQHQWCLWYVSIVLTTHLGAHTSNGSICCPQRRSQSRPTPLLSPEKYNEPSGWRARAWI